MDVSNFSYLRVEMRYMLYEMYSPRKQLSHYFITKMFRKWQYFYHIKWHWICFPNTMRDIYILKIAPTSFFPVITLTFAKIFEFLYEGLPENGTTSVLLFISMKIFIECLTMMLTLYVTKLTHHEWLKDSVFKTSRWEMPYSISSRAWRSSLLKFSVVFSEIPVRIPSTRPTKSKPPIGPGHLCRQLALIHNQTDNINL